MSKLGNINIIQNKGDYKSVIDIGAVIAQRRKSLRMTQEELAIEVGAKSKQYICNIEKGKKYPSLKRGMQIAKTLKLPAGIIIHHIVNKEINVAKIQTNYSGSFEIIVRELPDNHFLDKLADRDKVPTDEVDYYVYQLISFFLLNGNFKETLNLMNSYLRTFPSCIPFFKEHNIYAIDLPEDKEDPIHYINLKSLQAFLIYLNGSAMDLDKYSTNVNELKLNKIKNKNILEKGISIEEDIKLFRLEMKSARNQKLTNEENQSIANIIISIGKHHNYSKRTKTANEGFHPQKKAEVAIKIYENAKKRLDKRKKQLREKYRLESNYKELAELELKLDFKNIKTSEQMKQVNIYTKRYKSAPYNLNLAINRIIDADKHVKKVSWTEKVSNNLIASLISYLGEK